MSELRQWDVQGVHEETSNIEVRVTDQTPVGGRFDKRVTVTVEVLYAARSFLMPEQARHLASALMEAADFAEAFDA